MTELEMPFQHFEEWYKHAESSGVLRPDAVTLATASPDGRPSARMVLLRGRDERGYFIYTNYKSLKARDLAANPRCALVFYWAEIRRQVRIEGRAERLSREESESYFRTRPRDAQITAWVSRPGEVVPDRGELERDFARRAVEFEGKPVPMPGHWGGYRVIPGGVEFFESRPDRLHDRTRYVRGEDGAWQRTIISP